jgi:3-dehydroquinate synthase
MKSIKVNLKERSYSIVVGCCILKKLSGYIKKLNIGTDAYIITNNAIRKRYGRALHQSLSGSGFGVRYKLVADGEKSKSIACVADILKDLSGYDRRKKIFIVAFGGGVIGDLSGFVASIYRRGVPFIQVPTTLLAQVDSSIGGKTAVDLAEGKNLAGTFYQPRLVFGDVSLLKTLDRRQLKAGMAEVIKYAIIKDPVLFDYLKGNAAAILKGDLRCLERAVYRCCRIKAKIVEADEKEEKGIRTILNFGHTIGHAIEAAGGFKKYNHGESVSLGMLAASDLSFKLRLLDRQTLEKIEGLMALYGLPFRIKGLTFQKIIAAHYHDKKFKGKANRFVLIKKIGKTEIAENVPLVAIKEVVKGRMFQ